MDEWKFRFLNRIDRLKVRLSIFWQRNRLSIADLGSDSLGKLRRACRQFFRALHDKYNDKKQFCIEYLRHFKRSIVTDTKALCIYLCKYFPKHLTKINILFASTGLFLGFLFGLVLGLKSKHSRQIISDPNLKRHIKLQTRTEVTILVTISSLQFIDWLIYNENYGKFYRHLFGIRTKEENNLLSCGRAGCGLIIDFGSDVQRFQIGQEVWFLSPFWNVGTCSKTVVLDEMFVGDKPSNLSDKFAASLAYSGSKAILYVEELDSFHLSRKRIFVHGGDSLIGIILIQLLRKSSALITTTCTNKFLPIIESLGCEKILLMSSDNQNFDNTQLLKDLELCGVFDAIYLTIDTGLAIDDFKSFCKFPQFVISTLPIELKSDNLSAWQVFWFSSYVLLYDFFNYLWGNDKRYLHLIERKLTNKLLEKLKKIAEECENLSIILNSEFSANEVQTAINYIGTKKSLGNALIKFR